MYKYGLDPHSLLRFINKYCKIFCPWFPRVRRSQKQIERDNKNTSSKEEREETKDETEQSTTKDETAQSTTEDETKQSTTKTPKPSKTEEENIQRQKWKKNVPGTEYVHNIQISLSNYFFFKVIVGLF